MKLSRLSWPVLTFAVLAFSQASTPAKSIDGSYQIPIYINPTIYAPSKYTIYVSVGHGKLLPYLFDTGSPYMFTVFGAPGGTPTGSFAFGAGTLVYSYAQAPNVIGLGTAGGKEIVNTGKAVNVAEITQIDGTSISGAALADGTYGDFGTGFYGTSSLATVLAQIPLPSGLKLGYVVDVAGVNSGSGQLTLGLAPSTLNNLLRFPGALTMSMTSSGVKIPTATGRTSGFNRAQVGGTQVTFSYQGQAFALPLGTVFDSGGGKNSVIYDTVYGQGYNPINLLITYNGRIVESNNSTTPWGGSPQLVNVPDGGPRVNAGGFIYQSNILVFNVQDGQLTLIPASGTSPASFGRKSSIQVTTLGPNRYQFSGRVSDANGLRSIAIFVKEGIKSHVYKARLTGSNQWTATGIQSAYRSKVLQFQVLVLDRQGQTATHLCRVGVSGN